MEYNIREISCQECLEAIQEKHFLIRFHKCCISNEIKTNATVSFNTVPGKTCSKVNAEDYPKLHVEEYLDKLINVSKF